ncbi:hypothetical protein K491DRAFT_50608 [Lophiostoma macrostomum CBS 122681]|uniref:Secreted protein n=1 Tax=Lophiostoma macrostomum CBS 122681 TaxID=1314788 RepID=A0A6A6SXI8_9PLEO|nr:hypothetical protein K491DRAFT_50608 [Lophiostoma macrostomum CBS 122681]
MAEMSPSVRLLIFLPIVSARSPLISALTSSFTTAAIPSPIRPTISPNTAAGHAKHLNSIAHALNGTCTKEPDTGFVTRQPLPLLPDAPRRMRSHLIGRQQPSAPVLHGSSCRIACRCATRCCLLPLSACAGHICNP